MYFFLEKHFAKKLFNIRLKHFFDAHLKKYDEQKEEIVIDRERKRSAYFNFYIYFFF